MRAVICDGCGAIRDSDYETEKLTLYGRDYDLCQACAKAVWSLLPYANGRDDVIRAPRANARPEQPTSCNEKSHNEKGKEK